MRHIELPNKMPVLGRLFGNNNTQIDRVGFAGVQFAPKWVGFIVSENK